MSATLNYIILSSVLAIEGFSSIIWIIVIVAFIMIIATAGAQLSSREIEEQEKAEKEAEKEEELERQGLKVKPKFEPEDGNAPIPEEFVAEEKVIEGKDTLGNLFSRTWSYLGLHGKENAGMVTIAVRNYQFDIRHFHDEELHIETGWHLKMESLRKSLLMSGYQQVDYVSKKYQFAVRGGIMDIFTSSSKYPYRIDFFGDNVESIHNFDPSGQDLDCGTVGGKADIPLSEFIEVAYWKLVDGNLEDINLIEITGDFSLGYQFIGPDAQQECEDFILKTFELDKEEEAMFSLGPLSGPDRESF